MPLSRGALKLNKDKWLFSLKYLEFLVCRFGFKTIIRQIKIIVFQWKNAKKKNFRYISSLKTKSNELTNLNGL
jgi:hypothetical protein